VGVDESHGGEGQHHHCCEGRPPRHPGMPFLTPGDSGIPPSELTFLLLSKTFPRHGNQRKGPAQRPQRSRGCHLTTRAGTAGETEYSRRSPRPIM